MARKSIVMSLVAQLHTETTIVDWHPFAHILAPFVVYL